MGSKTFEVMAPYWAASSDRLAEPMNKIPKVVFSKGGFVHKTSYGETGQDASTWANAAVATDLIAGITKLKQQDRKTYCGSWRRRFCSGARKAWTG